MMMNSIEMIIRANRFANVDISAFTEEILISSSDNIFFHLSSLPLTFICYYRAYDNEDISIFPWILFVGERA